MRRARRLLAIAVLALIGISCASAMESDDVDFGDAPVRPIRVEVDNRNTYNVVVFARYRGQSRRLGEATALDQQILAVHTPIPAGVPVTFQLRAIGPSTRFQSQEFFLEGGDVVLIRVQPNIRQSTVSIR